MNSLRSKSALSCKCRSTSTRAPLLFKVVTPMYCGSSRGRFGSHPRRCTASSLRSKCVCRPGRSSTIYAIPAHQTFAYGHHIASSPAACTFPCTAARPHAKSMFSSSHRLYWAFLSMQTRHTHQDVLHASQTGEFSLGLFPAGQQQARVELPAVIIRVEANSINDDEKAVQQVNLAVSSGATAVVVEDTESGTAALYSAALKLKGVLRGRAPLLVLDRADIARATESDGVLMFQQGVPTVVVRQLLQGTSSLVGWMVSSPQSAASAAAEGSNFVVLTGEDGDILDAATVKSTRSEQLSRSAIPLISACSTASSRERLAAAVEAGLDGFCVTLPALQDLASTWDPSRAPGVQGGVTTLLHMLGGQAAAVQGSGPAAVAAPSRRANSTGQAWKLLSREHEELLEGERELLQRVLAVLQRVCPQMGEVGLLQDAVQRLDEPFLIVVVGEFNSGKSTMLNALLGGRFLADGILPTTNEITLIKYSVDGEDEVQQQADGMYVRHLPADLLRELNVVDTPGTNVILQRQQRLTEEYVPRADLVLFTLSADRPFTDSEVKFLQYIRQWRKKVVFVINKTDLLEGEEEVEMVRHFVAENATRLLNLGEPHVVAVSSRAALRAKIHAFESQNGSSPLQLLERDPQWRKSGFGHFEQWLVGYLAGGGDNRVSGEGLRLKLQTPLAVADALLAAARRFIEHEVSAAERNLQSVKSVQGQLEQFRRDMQVDGTAQRQLSRQQIQGAVGRADRFIDNTLQLSNVTALFSMMFGSGQLGLNAQFQEDVSKGPWQDLTKTVSEHTTWLRQNCENQLAAYRQFVAAQTATIGAQAAVEALAASSASISPFPVSALPPSLQSVQRFELGTVGTLLEEEIKDASVGTAGAAAGAQGVGLLAATVLPNTLEDLLALTVAGLASYVAVLNLPLRRAEIKKKMAALGSTLADEVEDGMKQELEAAVEGTIKQIQGMVGPLETAYEAALCKVKEDANALFDVEREMLEMQRRVAELE